LARAGQAPDGSPAASADAGLERALILKAVGARHGAGDVAAFADDIRGMDRTELARVTTSLGLRPGEYGHSQAWADSCAPTMSQMMRAENDPIYALKLSREKPGPDGLTESAREQKKVLEELRFFDKNGEPVKASDDDKQRYLRDGTMPPGATEAAQGKAVNKFGAMAEGYIKGLLDQPWMKKNLGAAEQKALEGYVENRRLSPEEEKTAQAALAKMRAHFDGQPNDKIIELMRGLYDRNADGTSTRKNGEGMAPEDALGDIVGGDWERRLTNGGRGGVNDRDLAEIDKRIADGVDVPIGVSNETSLGHMLLVTDVRGAAPARQYLISDPWTGKADWVSERELKDTRSNWPNKHFEIFPDHVVGAIYMQR
jgi:hypothetical protein